MTVTYPAHRRVGVNVAANLGRICLSEPARLDLCVYRGDNGRLRVTVTDPDGAPIDVSAMAWDCDIRRIPDAPTVAANMTVVPVTGQTNAVDLVLSAEQSALLRPETRFVWDLEMSSGNVVQTLLTGTFDVTPDVSRDD